MHTRISLHQYKYGRRIWIIVLVTLILGLIVGTGGCAVARLPEALNSRVVSLVYMQTGDSVTEISPGDGEGLFITPSINPKGDEVVFHGALTGYSRIWRYTQEDDSSVALTDEDYVAVEPSYSWDGMLISFAADKGIDQKRTDMSEIGNSLLKMGMMYLGGNPKAMNIYIMNSDGSALRQITKWDAVDMRPAFSPDGQQILFMSSKESGSIKKLSLYTVSVKGDEEPQMIPNSEGANRPWYSVDGEWIYYWKEIDDRGTLCQMSADGSEWHPLASDTGGIGSHGPFIDSSGEWLWFHSVQDTYNQIFKMPIGGGDFVSVTPPGFEEHHVAHVTAANNGNYTFDDLIVKKKR
jgi:Tol biopolymer transport system component